MTTFAEYLNQDWTGETKQAWIDAFAAISALMLNGAGENYAPS